MKRARPSIAYYTVYCGGTRNSANSVHAPPAPGRSFYYSNNTSTLELARQKGWRTIKLKLPIKNDQIGDCMDAKRGKACPHDFKELCSFDYSVFLDSKLRVDTRKIEELICTHGAPAYFRRHPFVTGPVWNEYNLSMYQKRYEVQKDAYRAYIAHQVAQGLVEETPDHLACGFIIRDMHHLAVKEMGEAWMRHIHECGIQDQISFYFVKQLFPGLVRPIEPSEDILI